jgi:tetratricopeptide (TPR) repeat protein
MTNALVPLMKHTPSAQDPGVLEGITVQRGPLISNLVEVALEGGGGARHQLLIGPRGIGKTHVLAVVANRVRAAADGSDLSLAWLEEDPWSISSYQKLLAAILASLAAERGDADLEADAESLRAMADHRPDRVEQALRDATGDSRLLLLVENLDDIFRRIGDNGQERLRAFIENWPQLLVFATAPRLFEGVSLHESPFYGFFAISHLDELTLESAVDLMRRVAVTRGDADLASFFSTEVANRRLAAVKALAGGHPRLWLLLSGCISVESIDELVPIFLEALDELTPYYQDRLRELGVQQQEALVRLSEASGALSNRGLAERTGIPQNQIATILRQLSDRGYVRRAEVPEDLVTGDARASYWELREPLMRLCLDVKKARGRPLRMVVDFLRAWYGPRLLDQLASLPPSAQLATSYLSEAFMSLDAGLDPETLFMGSPSEIVARAEVGLSLVPERPELALAKGFGLILQREIDEAEEVFRPLVEAAGERSPLALAAAVTMHLARNGSAEEADEIAARLRALGESIGPEPSRAAAFLGVSFVSLARFEDAIYWLRRSLESDPEDPIALGELGKSLSATGREDEAVETYLSLCRLRPHEPDAFRELGRCLDRLGKSEEALDAFDKGLWIDPAGSGLDRGRALVLIKLGRNEEALEGLGRALSTDPGDALALAMRGISQRVIGKPEEGLADLRRAVEIAPAHPFFQEQLALSLRVAGLLDEALETVGRLVRAEPDRAPALNSYGMVLGSLGRHQEAADAFARSAALEPAPVALCNLGAAMFKLGRFEDALLAFEKGLEDDPDDLSLTMGRASSLLNLRRYKEAVDGYRHAVDLAPENIAVLADLALALRWVDGREESSEWLRKAIELEPKDPGIHLSLGRNLAAVGSHAEALEEFLVAEELDPSGAASRNEQANVLRELGSLEEAEAAVLAAIELDGEDSIARFTAFEVALSHGDLELALSRLRIALELWAEDKKTPPGEVDLMCAILFGELDESAGRRDVISRIAQMYDEFGVAEELGRGVVTSISSISGPGVDVEVAEAWVHGWLDVPEILDLEIPKRMLRAALGWKKDRDRTHLMALPLEQRRILTELLDA